MKKLSNLLCWLTCLLMLLRSKIYITSKSSTGDRLPVWNHSQSLQWQDVQANWFRAQGRKEKLSVPSVTHLLDSEKALFFSLETNRQSQKSRDKTGSHFQNLHVFADKQNASTKEKADWKLMLKYFLPTCNFKPCKENSILSRLPSHCHQRKSYPDGDKVWPKKYSSTKASRYFHWFLEVINHYIHPIKNNFKKPQQK